MQYRAAGLSRLSCVTDFRIATAFYPCGGRPLTIGRVRLLAGCSTHRRAARYAASFRGESSPAGMVPEFRPERHLFPQCEAVLGFTQTCQKRSVPMSFEGSRSRTITPLGSGIPPAAAPSFRGASMGRKESIRETGIEPAFSWKGSDPTRLREVFRPHPGPGGMPRYSPHGSGAPPSASSRAAAVLLHMPRYVGILVRPAVRRGSVG